MTDDKLKTDVSEWLAEFMRDHFPQGLPATMSEIMHEVLFLAYLDGVAYGQEVAETERRIIIPGR